MLERTKLQNLNTALALGIPANAGMNWGTASKSSSACGRTRACALSANIDETVRRERRPYLAGANPARQLSLQPVAVGAAEGGNDLG